MARLGGLRIGAIVEATGITAVRRYGGRRVRGRVPGALGRPGPGESAVTTAAPTVSLLLTIGHDTLLLDPTALGSNQAISRFEDRSVPRVQRMYRVTFSTTHAGFGEPLSR